MTRATNPANSGLVAENREISVRARMRGGPGRCCTCLKIQLLIPGEGQNRTIEPQIQFLPLAHLSDPKNSRSGSLLARLATRAS